ncbi:hypothetical protein C8R46DRAFT_1114873, partial [Mycena filopes]
MTLPPNYHHDPPSHTNCLVPLPPTQHALDRIRNSESLSRVQPMGASSGWHERYLVQPPQLCLRQVQSTCHPIRCSRSSCAAPSPASASRVPRCIPVHQHHLRRWQPSSKVMACASTTTPGLRPLPPLSYARLPTPSTLRPLASLAHLGRGPRTPLPPRQPQLPELRRNWAWPGTPAPVSLQPHQFQAQAGLKTRAAGLETRLGLKTRVELKTGIGLKTWVQAGGGGRASSGGILHLKTC